MIGIMGGSGSPDVNIVFGDAYVSAEQYDRPSPVSAAYRIGSDKKVYFGLNGAFTEYATWCGAGASPSGYEAFAQVTASDLHEVNAPVSGPLGAWVSLSAGQTWTLSMVGGFGAFQANSATMTIEIRNAATLRRVTVITVKLQVQKF